MRQAYDSGWRVTVDGKGVDAAPDALGMLSLPVAPGRHVIELERRVHLDFIAGLAVAIVTALALLFRGLRARWRRN